MPSLNLPISVLNAFIRYIAQNVVLAMAYLQPLFILSNYFYVKKSLMHVVELFARERKTSASICETTHDNG